MTKRLFSTVSTCAPESFLASIIIYSCKIFNIFTSIHIITANSGTFLIATENVFFATLQRRSRIAVHKQITLAENVLWNHHLFLDLKDPVDSFIFWISWPFRFKCYATCLDFDALFKFLVALVFTAKKSRVWLTRLAKPNEQRKGDLKDLLLWIL